MSKLEGAIVGHDLVYHMAANSDISQGAKYTDIDLKNGTLATYNTLEAMRKTGVKKMVFASTSAIYGEADVKPTPESYGPLFPISFYARVSLLAKACARRSRTITRSKFGRTGLRISSAETPPTA